jgi:hypothetical protein
MLDDVMSDPQLAQLVKDRRNDCHMVSYDILLYMTYRYIVDIDAKNLMAPYCWFMYDKSTLYCRKLLSQWKLHSRRPKPWLAPCRLWGLPIIMGPPS